MALNGVAPEPPPPAAAEPAEPGEMPADPASRADHRALALRAAEIAGVPPRLFLRLVTRESGWNPAALSPKGAIGLAQLMPATARALGVDPGDPGQNLLGGARYLAAQHARFGAWDLALAAYNAGPEAVERHGGIPPYRETQAYVAALIGAAPPEPGPPELPSEVLPDASPGLASVAPAATVPAPPLTPGSPSTWEF